MACKNPKYLELEENVIQPPHCECLECWSLFLTKHPQFKKVVKTALSLTKGEQHP